MEMVLGIGMRTGKYSPTPPPVVAMPSQCYLPTGLDPKTSRDLINKSSNFRVASFHALVQPKAPSSSSSSPALHFTMTKQQANWSPYDNNGGSCVAIAGADYCVVAADTRMSTGYNILTRDYSKICKLADKSVMASSGFQADVRALQKQLAARHSIYQHQHNKQMSCPAMAQLLSNTLYYKRFFPYYAFNVLGGLDNEGKGCVFTYDAVGSYEKVGYSAQGSGSTLIMPVLDRQLKSPSPLLLPAQDAVTPLSEAEAIDLVKTVFVAATERDIYTGDKVEIVVLNADGIHREYMDLRKD
ncbi:hypothetical protein TIFTF001_012270 [Ficus carica]|uniref:Proteasome subunit beta n=1 Tax=Ficus carica TaxID=3494 RepID=A0AA87ZZR0_FICCA|nr:hypothetical protein TIFTF001_012270 [Ficus carica]